MGPCEPLVVLPSAGLSTPSLGTSTEARGRAPEIADGQFLTARISFVIVAWAVFLLVQAANRIWREPVAAEEAPAATAEEQLLTEIRDLLAHDRAA